MNERAIYKRLDKMVLINEINKAIAAISTLDGEETLYYDIIDILVGLKADIIEGLLPARSTLAVKLLLDMVKKL